MYLEDIIDNCKESIYNLIMENVNVNTEVDYMNKKGPTIKDIALEANVSIGTVDRVLHHRGRTSDSKEKAVMAAIKKLGFKPNAIASALAMRKNQFKIGVTYPDVERDFWRQVGEGIIRAEKELTPFGVEVICKPSKNYEIDEQIEVLKSFVEIGVNGILFVPANASKLNKFIDELSAQEISVATFISDVPLSKRILFVGQDDMKSGILAGKLTDLFLRGKGKVAVLRVHRDIRCIQQRISGFIEKIDTECPDIDITTFYDIYENAEEIYKNTYDVTAECIKNNPDLNAIYIPNGLTEWVAEAVDDMGKQGQILVIGHEYSEGIEKYLDKGIIGATIYQNPSEEAYVSMKLLYQHITKSKISNGEIIKFSTNIIMRENSPSIFG
jgi:LacI family transcriptional regulator